MRKTTPRDIDEAKAGFRDLSRVLSSLSGPAEVEKFLRELCTPAECVDLAKRWKLVQELVSGKTQRAVARENGMSLCRITRGARYAKAPDSILAARARAKVGRRTAGLLAAALFAAVSALFPASASAGESFADVWIADRLSVGLGIGFSSLTDNHRRADKEAGYTYVGFVNRLEDKHAAFVFPQVSWWAARNVRLHLAMDHVEAHTRNYNNRHSDGNVTLIGPAFEVQFILPLLDDTLFPSLGVGAAWENAKFRAERWWHYGWYSREEYLESGEPGKTKSGYLREIKVDDSLAWSVSGGVSWRPVDRFQLDATLRHVWVEPDCEYGETRKKSGYASTLSGKFWLDHLTASLAASFVF